MWKKCFQDSGPQATKKKQETNEMSPTTALAFCFEKFLDCVAGTKN